MIATKEQYTQLADILARFEESADGYWKSPTTYRFEIRYDGRSRVYIGDPDLEAFTRDLLRQSECSSIESALEKADTARYGDDTMEWILNCVLNQLHRV